MKKSNETTPEIKCPYCERPFTPGVFTEPFKDNYEVDRWITIIACSECKKVINCSLVDPVNRSQEL